MKTNELGVIIASDRDRIECAYMVKCRSEDLVKWAEEACQEIENLLFLMSLKNY